MAHRHRPWFSTILIRALGGQSDVLGTAIWKEDHVARHTRRQFGGVSARQSLPDCGLGFDLPAPLSRHGRFAARSHERQCYLWLVEPSVRRGGGGSNGGDNNGSGGSGSGQGSCKSGDDKGGDDSGDDKSGGDNSGSDSSGSDSSGSDSSGSDGSGSDSSGSDSSGSDTSKTSSDNASIASTDNSGTDNSSTDNSGTDQSGGAARAATKSGGDSSGGDSSGGDSSGSHHGTDDGKDDGKDDDGGGNCLATLTLNKKVINDNGGTATIADFTLTATSSTGGVAVISGVDPNVSATIGISAQVPVTDTYVLSETNMDGYDASAWHCSAGTLAGDVLTLAAGDVANCTITNDDTPPPPVPTTITVDKLLAR